MAPLAWLASKVIDPVFRAWAQVRLAMRIQGAVPSSAVILGMPQIEGTGRITLGNNAYLEEDLYFETREGGDITIGDGVVISRGVHLVAYAGIRIGNGAKIGEYASIRDANRQAEASGSVQGSRRDAAPIEIGDNAWIGRGVTVLPGVKIGAGAVVGANAVVSRDVPTGLVVAGIPARPVKD